MDLERFQCTGYRCSIQDLSAELVLMIMKYLPLQSHFDLACTCKRLAITSRGVIERHQDCYRKYRVASDLDPSTVPLLLRSAFGYRDPIPAWHVRSFEVWKDRKNWSEWQTLDLHTPLIARLDSKPSPFRVSKEDARRYLYWFEQQLGKDLDFQTVKYFLNQVERGHDGLLKALLFAKLSRLEDLKFVTRSQEPGSCLLSLRTLIFKCIQKETHYDSDSDSGGDCNGNDDEDKGSERGPDGNNDSDNPGYQDNESNGIHKLDTIERHSTTATAPWPVGFCNIQKVAVGVKSGTWMDYIHDEEPSTVLFYHLLRLPSLNSIYFNRLCACDDDMETDQEEEAEYIYKILPKGCSSVKHIFLHGCSGTLGEMERSIWKAPQELLTVSLRHDGPEEFDGATGTANALARVQKNSLQSLMWYGYTGGFINCNIMGDHCSILDDEEFDHFKRLPAMKQISVSVHDINLCMEHADTYQCLRSDPHEGRDDDDDQGHIYDEDDHDEFILRRVATMFPRTIETLVLWDHPGEKLAPLLERGIIKMIQGGQYKNLKSIFLEATERAPEGEMKEKLWYQDATAAGMTAGVDVHTLTNREVMRHSIEFVEAPDEYDLKSGIHSGVRPSDWVFDSYLGRRIPPSSRNAQYNALWARPESRCEVYHEADS
ncbi:Nn.00g095840.m01.CDS01 [Neocucurbitaria sp. VM-36]